MKRSLLIGGATVLALGGFALGQMIQTAPVPPPLNNSAVAVDQPELELEALQDQWAQMAEEERQVEEDYLSVDLSPKTDVTGIGRVPSADQNQPYRTCEKTPEMKASLKRYWEDGARAYRDIDGYLSVTNVIVTQDCSCAAKIIPHAAIVAFQDRLRAELGVDVLLPEHTSELSDEYDRLKNVVDTICGKY